jgi:hypothetical protein
MSLPREKNLRTEALDGRGVRLLDKQLDESLQEFLK